MKTEARTTTGRSETINLRASQKQKGLIGRAAEAVLLDRRYFALSQDAFKRFTTMLDNPPANNPKLQRLLRTRAPWEK